MIHDQTIKTVKKPFFFWINFHPWTAPKSSKLWQKDAFPAKQEFGLTLVQAH